MDGGSAFSRVTNTHPTAAVLRNSTVLVRFIVGLVFFSEGLQKFLFTAELGVGRFIKIGIPAPEILAPFVGIVEIVGGALLLAGLLTRLASIALMIDILVAIATTKIPMLLHDGLWKMAHEARVDFSMLFGLVFLLLAGAGACSLDGYLERRKTGQGP